MENLIEIFLLRIIEAVNEISDPNALLNITLQDWLGGTVWNYMRQLNQAILVIASSLIALFVLLEFIKLVTRGENLNGVLGLEKPAMILFKLVFCATVMTHLMDLLNMVLNEVIVLQGNITEQSSFAITLSNTQINDFANSLSMGEKMGVFTALFICWVASKIMTIIVDLICYGRMIELAIFTCIAPIPVSTLPSEEYKSIGINFFKNYVGVCLQGLFIVLIMNLFRIIISNLVGNGALQLYSGDTAQATSIAWDMIKYMAILVMALFSSNKWAKSIVNAM